MKYTIDYSTEKKIRIILLAAKKNDKFLLSHREIHRFPHGEGAAQFGRPQLTSCHMIRPPGFDMAIESSIKPFLVSTAATSLHAVLLNQSCLRFVIEGSARNVGGPELRRPGFGIGTSEVRRRMALSLRASVSRLSISIAHFYGFGSNLS